MKAGKLYYLIPVYFCVVSYLSLVAFPRGFKSVDIIIQLSEPLGNLAAHNLI